MTMFFAILALFLVLPGAASADPVSSAIFTWLASSGVAVGTATAIATFATRVIVGLGASLLGQLFQEKPKVKQRGIQTEQTTSGDVTPLTFIVGRYATEGHLIAPGYSRGKNNKILTYIVDVSNVPVTGLSGRVAINGQWTSLVADGTDPDKYWFDDLGDGKKGWLWFFDGTQTAAFQHLVDEYGTHSDRPWTSDHIIDGGAYAVLEFEFDREVYSGFPKFRFEVDGIKLYDPRKDSTVGGSGSHRWSDTGTWEFTKNPQVINYNILRGINLPTGDIYGGMIPAEDLPLDNWFAAMNACDALIGSRVTYEAGFEIDVSKEPFEIIKEMNKASFAQLSELGGVFKVRVGAPASPVMSITDDDIVITKPSDLEPFPGLAQTSNAITGTYIEPVDVWQGRSADPIYNATWEADDGDRRLTTDVSLPAVSNKSQAQHLLNSYIKDNRRFITHGLVLPASCAALEQLDAIEWTSDRNGYTAKVFEVVEVEDHLDTMLQFVRVREREATDTSWTPGDDVAAPGASNGLTKPPDRVPSLTVTAFTIEDDSSDEVLPAIKIEWADASEAQPSDLIRYQVRKVASGEIVASSTIGADEGETVAAGLANDTAYEVRARYVTEAPSDWSAWSAVTTPDVQIGSAVAVGAGISLTAPAVVVQADAYGSNPDMSDSGTDISVFSGGQQLAYDGTGNANGTFDISATVTFGNISIGAISDVGNDARVANHSSMSTDVARIKYTATGKDPNGKTFTAEAHQIITKNKADVRSAGVYHVSVSSMPVNSFQASSAFLGASNTPNDQVIGDQAWFYIGPQGDPALQEVWVYNGSSWEFFEHSFTGGIVTDGSIAAQKLILNGVMLESSGGQLIIRNSGVDTPQIAGFAATNSDEENYLPSSGLAGDNTFNLVATAGFSLPYPITAEILLIVSFEQGYFGAQDWGFKIDQRQEGGPITTLLQRDGMVQINDYPTMQIMTQINTTSSSDNFFFGYIYWKGENSNITLTRANVSSFTRYR